MEIFIQAGTSVTIDCAISQNRSLQRVTALRANDLAAPNGPLSQAVEHNSSDPRGQLRLGAALHAARRYAEAIKCFKQAQTLPDDDPPPIITRAVSHAAASQSQSPLSAASKACYPELATAYYMEGEAWTAMGEAARAEQSFAKATQSNPGWADAWINYGVACYRQGRVEDAKAAMRRALAVDPGHLVAIANLGAFMVITGELEEAEQLLRETVAREPNAFGARLNLAAYLLNEDHAAEALALLDAWEPPDDPLALQNWRLQRSAALLKLNREPEARKILDDLARLGPVPPSLLPMLHWRRLQLALGEGNPTQARELAEAMESSIQNIGSDAFPEQPITARIDLGGFWRDQDEPSRAFEQWAVSHKLLKQSQPFVREVHSAFYDALINSFSATRLKDGARATNGDPTPVFIVGLPRSGSTLIEQVLAAHRDVHGAGERPALQQRFKALGGDELDPNAVRRMAALDRECLDRAAARYLAELHQLAPNATRVVDKMGGNYLFLGLVALMLPGARIIHSTRDPRDIGLSIFTFRFFSGMHGYAHDLRDLGWYIGEHDRVMAHWKSVLPNPMLTLKLSDWVADFDGTLARVLNFLELPQDANCTRFYELDRRIRTVSRAQVRQPVNARGIGRWMKYASQLAPLIGELERTGSLEAWRTDASAEIDPSLTSSYTFWLAQSCRDSGERERALANYLKRAQQGFYSEEVFYSLYQAGLLQESLSFAPEEVLATFNRASKVSPTRAEALHAAARYCRALGRNNEAYHYARRGAAMTMPDACLLIERWVYDYGLLEELARNAFCVGRYQECIQACQRLLREGKIALDISDGVKKIADFAAGIIAGFYIPPNHKRAQHHHLDKYGKDFPSSGTGIGFGGRCISPGTLHLLSGADLPKRWRRRKGPRRQ